MPGLSTNCMFCAIEWHVWTILAAECYSRLRTDESPPPEEARERCSMGGSRSVWCTCRRDRKAMSREGARALHPTRPGEYLRRWCCGQKWPNWGWSMPSSLFGHRNLEAPRELFQMNCLGCVRGQFPIQDHWCIIRNLRITLQMEYRTPQAVPLYPSGDTWLIRSFSVNHCIGSCMGQYPHRFFKH